MDRQPGKVPGKEPAAKKRKEPPPASNGPKSQAKDGRANKRAKFRDARTIRTQPSDAALKDGELDLQSFLSAREFEIKALENSMRKTKAASASRAFQKVPRAMRRRTASHNVKRVPKRLRARAKREQLEDNTPPAAARKRRPRTTRARLRAETAKRLGVLAEKKRKRKLKDAAQKKATPAATDGSNISGGQPIHTRPARPKIRRNRLNEPQKPKSRFRKRQINKTWLPTHLWHAKRARMTEAKQPLWRFAIPLTPTEKCYRPTHRASGDKGAVVWDMSYTSTIGLYGSALGIERVLRALGVTQERLWSTNGRKWRAGCKKWSGMLSKERKGARRDIGPATLIWNPELGIENATEEDAARVNSGQRQLLIRLHPSCFLELFNEVLKLVRMQTPQLYVEDLRFEIGSIELTGPSSTEALLATLHPYHNKAESGEQHATVFKSLVGVTNPASLPADSLLAFSIMDPRLRYPPKRMPVGGEGDIALLETLAKWPVGETSKPFGLFDRNARFEAGSLPSQKSINRRRGSGRPGEPLDVTAADPPIPIILLASRPPAGGQVQGTWTLLAPWKCIQPIWYSLVHHPLSTGGNPRYGGLNELRQVAFEQGVPWFPGDFPGTDSGAEWELEQRAKRKAQWDRRPRGKKVEWTSLDLGAGRKGEVGSGLACDWEHLFGLATDAPQAINDADESLADDTSRMDVDTTEASISDKGKEAPTTGKSRESLALVNQLSKSAFTAFLVPSATGTPPPCSIATVNLTFVSKGVATTCARIYRLPQHLQITVLPSTLAEVPSTEVPQSNAQASLPTDLRDQWLSRLPLKSRSENSTSAKPRTSDKTPPAPRMPAGADMATRKRLVAESLLGTPLPYPRPPANQTDIGGHPLCPDEKDLIGFVTAGAFSLSEGKGTAIGCVSAEKALEGCTAAGKTKEGRLCVVRNAGERVGWLARWEPV